MGNASFVQVAFHLTPEIVQELGRRGENVWPPWVFVRAVPMIVRDWLGLVLTAPMGDGMRIIKFHVWGSPPRRALKTSE